MKMKQLRIHSLENNRNLEKSQKILWYAFASDLEAEELIGMNGRINNVFRHLNH